MKVATTVLPRYPGKGNPAYDGMCELLHSEHQRYENSIQGNTMDQHGIVPAKRGFLTIRRMERTNHCCQGSDIQVILNKEQILNTDLSKVSSFMANKAHRGI